MSISCQSLRTGVEIFHLSYGILEISDVFYFVLHMGLSLSYGITGVVWQTPCIRQRGIHIVLEPVSNLDAVLFCLNIANTPHQNHKKAVIQLVPLEHV